MMKNTLYLFSILLLLNFNFTSAERCGKGFGKCPEGQCCSKHGYCGKLEVYCGAGCQSEFGMCNDVKVPKSDKNEKNEKLAEKIVDVVDALLNEDLSDDESKNEIVEGVIDELANEIVEESDNEENEEEVEEAQEVHSEEEETENQDDEATEVKDENTTIETKEPVTSTTTNVPTTTSTSTITETTTTTTIVETTTSTKIISTTTTTSSTTTTTTNKSNPTSTPSDSSNECSNEILGMAQPFNAFFFGDFTGFSSDVQGRLAAKGTVNISGGYQNGAFTYDPVKHNQQTYLDCNDDKMKGDIKYSIVAGSLNFRDGGEILNGGVAYQNKVELPGYIREAIERHHCPIEKKNIIDFEKEKKNLIALSEKLENMRKNVKTKNEWGKLVIELVPGQKLYVINISNINEFWNIEIKENGVNTDEITIVFNIPNNDVVTFSNYDISGLNKYATRILWNVPNASKVLIQNFRIQGSLLAPKSDIEGYNGNIQGQIIGNSFKGNLQMDWVPFFGCL